MIKQVSTSNPYSSLCDDLYSLGIFDKDINGLISIVEKDDEYQTLLVIKKFANEFGSHVSSGFYFIQCIDSICNEEHLKQFRHFLEEIVKQRTNGNYMEVDPIIFAPEYDEDVLNFVSKYNVLQKRKPIQLYKYG